MHSHLKLEKSTAESHLVAIENCFVSPQADPFLTLVEKSNPFKGFSPTKLANNAPFSHYGGYQARWETAEWMCQGIDNVITLQSYFIIGKKMTKNRLW